MFACWSAPKIECELCYMGCLWLQCSLGRPLAALTCAVKRCQPWFAIVHLWSPWVGADGLKKPHSGALNYHLFKDYCCPWLSDIHFTYISSSDIRSSMTLGLCSESILFSYWYFVLTIRYGVVSQFLQRTEVDGLSSRDCFQAEVTGGTVFDRTVPFSQRGVSETGGCMCEWVHRQSFLLTSWFWYHTVSWMRRTAFGLQVSGVLSQWSISKTESDFIFVCLFASVSLSLFFFPKKKTDVLILVNTIGCNSPAISQYYPHFLILWSKCCTNWLLLRGLLLSDCCLGYKWWSYIHKKLCSLALFSNKILNLRYRRTQLMICHYMPN